MQRAGRQVKSARVQEQETALACGDGGEFGEADIVADCEGDLTIGRDVNERQLVAG